MPDAPTVQRPPWAATTRPADAARSRSVLVLAHRPRTKRWTRGALAAAVLAFVVPGLAAAFVMGPLPAGGDSGQWVMLARAYQGLPVPAYRDPFAVPPAAPLLMVAALEVQPDPFEAPKLALTVAFGLVGLAAFLLGREVFGTVSGLVAALVVGVGQHFYLRLAVYGALPQLLALASFGLALAAIARHARQPGKGSQALVALAACGIVASHAPTAAVAVPVLGLVLLAAPPRLRVGGPGGFQRLVRRGWPVLPAGLLFAGYVVAKRATFDQYLTNEATFATKGLGVALQQVLQLKPSSALPILGSALLLALLVEGLRAGWLRAGAARALTWRPPRWMPALRAPGQAALAASVLALPVVLIAGLMVLLYALRVGTDYPRIFPLLGLPAVVALGALLPAQLPRAGARAPARREGRVALVALLLLVPVAAGVVSAEQRAAPFYSVREAGDLEDALGAVERQLPAEGTVWTPVREGKWLEGVTGRSALFALPAWAIFRPWEWERKLAAETLAGASAWMGSGSMAARFQRAPAVSQANPEVAVYYKGELQPLLQLRDDESRVRVLLPHPTDVRFTSLGQRSESVRIEGDLAIVEERALGTVYAASGAPVKLEVVRKATLQHGGTTLLLEVQARSQGAPLEAVVLALRPEGDGTWGVRRDVHGLRLETLRNAEPLGVWLREGPSSSAVLASAGSDAGSEGLDLFLAPQAGAAGPRTEARGTLQVEAEPVGHPVAQLKTVTAEGALKAFDVRGALLPKEGMGLARASAEALGFRVVHENDSYVVLRRGAGP